MQDFITQLPYLLNLYESSNTLRPDKRHIPPTIGRSERKKQKDGKITGEDWLPLATEQREEE